MTVFPQALQGILLLLAPEHHLSCGTFVVFIGVRNFETADEGVTEGKTLTKGETVGAITEGTITEVE